MFYICKNDMKFSKLKYGFHFFPLSDKTSYGFILKVSPKIQFYVRYSRVTGIWYLEKNIMKTRQEFLEEMAQSIVDEPIENDFEKMKIQLNTWQGRCQIALM